MGIDRAGGVIGGADIDDIGADRIVRHRQEAVFHRRIGVDHLPAGHDVGVDIDRVDGVGDEDGVVLIEKVEDVADVRFRAVAHKDLVHLEGDAFLLIIPGNRLPQEVIPLFRAVAAEGLLDPHFSARLLEGRDDGGAEGKGDVADAEADDRLAGVGRLVGGNLVVDVGEEVALLQIEVVAVDFHGGSSLVYNYSLFEAGCFSHASGCRKVFSEYILGAAHASLSAAKLWTASEVRKMGAWERCSEVLRSKT